MSNSGDRPALAALDDALWHRRRLSERLLYALTAAQLLLEAGREPLLPHAAQDVQDAIDRLHETDLATRRAQRRVALDLAYPSGVTSLAALAGRAPEPWATILADHAATLDALAREIGGTLARDRELAERALHQVRDELSVLESAGDELAGTPAPLAAGSSPWRHAGGRPG